LLVVSKCSLIRNSCPFYSDVASIGQNHCVEVLDRFDERCKDRRLLRVGVGLRLQLVGESLDALRVGAEVMPADA